MGVRPPFSIHIFILSGWWVPSRFPGNGPCSKSSWFGSNCCTEWQRNGWTKWLTWQLTGSVLHAQKAVPQFRGHILQRTQSNQPTSICQTESTWSGLLMASPAPPLQSSPSNRAADENILRRINNVKNMFFLTWMCWAGMNPARGASVARGWKDAFINPMVEPSSWDSCAAVTKIGLQMKPRKDAAPELSQSLNLL